MDKDKEEEVGARPQADQALVASDGAPSGLHPAGFDPSRKLFLNRSEVVGTLAMWAVRQCPYPVPERLEAALEAAYERLPEELDGWFWATEEELRALVLDLCLNEPEVAKWNEPRSGHNATTVFSSRYDRPSPDDDFIDLHALANNICRTLIADQYECDSDGSPTGGDACGSVEDDSAVTPKSGNRPSPERTPHV